MALAVLAVVTFTRVPLAPKYLYYFDSVNFSLAIDEFNPALHQPQPPGYPLFVVLLRLVHLAAPKAEHTLLAAGILTAVLAVVLIWWLGERMFSPAAGFAAAMLLILNPAFWLAGISNQVRLWLAAGGLAAAGACWLAIERPRSKGAFLIACASLGIAAGFRPAMLLLLFPLLVFCGVASSRGLREWLLGALVLAASAGPWLGYTVAVSGGPAAFLGLVRDYAQDQFSASSLLMGAPLNSAWRMSKAAVVWNGLGVLSWIWALALCYRRAFQPEFRHWFLAAWFLPPFLFHAAIHVGDPDHTLVTVAALCLAGGAVIGQLRHRLTREGFVIANGLALCLNALLFFLPVGGLAGASMYGMVARIDSRTRATFDAIGELRRDGPVTLVAYDSFVTWRHLSYYFPETPLIVLRQSHRGAIDPALVSLMQNRRTHPAQLDDMGRILLPPSQRLIWLMPATDPGAVTDLAPAADLRQNGPVYFSDVAGQKDYQLGGYRFTARPAALSSR